MRRLHNSVVRPLLEAMDAKEIVEVGADDGGHTALLQQYCHGVDGRLTIIDPAPSDGLHRVLDDRVSTLLLRPSLEVLADLPTADAVLIDGDHNYYTVGHELELLAQRSDADGRALPLILLHDVGWPWGRRDMYYDIARVPERHQQSSDTRGLARGDRGKVQGPGGFNAGLRSARIEGGQRNGVLSAVEDFVGDDPDRRLVVVPGMHGLAVIVTTPIPAPLAELLTQFEESSELLRLVSAVESARLDAELERLEAEHETLEQTSLSAHLRERLTGTEAELAAATQRTAEAEQSTVELEAALDQIRSHPALRLSRPVRRAASDAARAAGRLMPNRRH